MSWVKQKVWKQGLHMLAQKKLPFGEKIKRKREKQIQEKKILRPPRQETCTTICGKATFFLKVKVDIEINYTLQKISLTDDLQSCNVPLDGKSGQ